MEWPSQEHDNSIILEQEDKMAKIKGFLGLRAGSTASISDDGQAATIGFSNLEVKIGDQTPALAAIQVESFILQLSEHATELPIKLSAQGYVFTTAGTRALLVAHMDDATPFLSFPPVSDQSILHSLEATVPAGVDVPTALFLLAERTSDDESSSAYLNVATLDFSLES
jgi:hypothetical protein